MNAILLSLVTFFSTCFGGFFALRFRQHLHLIMGFTAGILIGVVGFDLLPAMFELMEETPHLNKVFVFGALVVGFLFFHLLEKLFFLLKARQTGNGGVTASHHPFIGLASALVFAHGMCNEVTASKRCYVNWVHKPFRVYRLLVWGLGKILPIAESAHPTKDGLEPIHLNSASRCASRGLAVLSAQHVALREEREGMTRQSTHGSY